MREKCLEYFEALSTATSSILLVALSISNMLCMIAAHCLCRKR
jgi:hypothetical protein